MQAMVLEKARNPLRRKEVPLPALNPDQVLLRVSACAVCRTDLHVVDGELPHPSLPLIPGHEIVGYVEEKGKRVDRFSVGDRVGVPWLGFTCGACPYCRSGRENLCDQALFTGYQIDGGYAQYAAADARFVFSLPESYSDERVAPLLCAGLIGYRSLKMAGDAEKIGFYGFGAAAHLLTQVARHQGRRVYAFTRPGDRETQAFALRVGAVWAGDSTSLPPEELEAAILFAPAGELVPQALKTLAKGGVVVCGGIHMSDLPSFPYELLWGERSVRSVANLTRKDGEEFLKLASQVTIESEVRLYPLCEANEALKDLKEGKVKGAAVLKMT